MKFSGEKGIAMVTAIVLALIVSVTAAVVLSLTFRRFELSAFRTDHAIAAGTAEAGFQYAFARLDLDTAFRTAVQTKRTALGAGAVAANNVAAEYVVTCHRSVAPTADLALDEQPAAQQGLHMGTAAAGKHVTLRIRFFTAADSPPFPARPYRVRSFSNFGTGGQ